MKKLSYIGCILVCCLLVSGCSIKIAMPDSLIEPPASNQDKVKMKQIVTSQLGNDEGLVIPTATDYPMAYLQIDIDLDEQEEILAFYNNKEHNFLLGFFILKQQEEEQWQIAHKATAYGTSIDYFNILDLNNDGMQEIIFGVKTGYGSSKELYIFQLRDKEMIQFTESSPIAYDRIAIGESGNQKQIITALNDTTELSGRSLISVYQIVEHQLQTVFSDSYVGFCKELIFAPIGTDAYGIYLAMLHNHFASVMLLGYQQGGIELLYEMPLDYDIAVMNEMSIFEDINKDGILEVCAVWTPEENNTSKGYADFIKIWLAWNGNGGFEAVQTVLSNKADGYEFYIPTQWVDQLYYDFRYDGSIQWTDFFNMDENLQLHIVFSIAAVDQSYYDANDDLKRRSVILGNNPSKKKIYIATLDEKLADELQITERRLIECLKIEGGK